MAQDAGVRMLDGSLSYRERIALAPGALVVLEARDQNGRDLAETVFLTRGAQVPIGFEMGVPAGIDMVLDAAIYVDGRAAWVASDLEIPAGTETVSLGNVTLGPYLSPFFAATYRCGGTGFPFRAAVAGAVLDVAGRMRVLARSDSAAGPRYEAPDDAGTWVRPRGSSALISVDGVEFAECSAVPPDPPAAYRAGGNEPGWSVMLAEGRAEITLDYGARQVSGVVPDWTFEAGAMRFAWENEDIAVTIEPALCRDTMTGMPYPDRATLETGGRTLPGCGGDPLTLLAGPEWTVATLAGVPVDGAAPATLSFGRDGALGGQTGCNRFATTISVGGEAISLGPIAATQMLCEDALMTRERQFFEVLARIARFDVSEAGDLLLYGAADAAPILTATR